ncbi:MAG: DUF4168 domain-containing protein [Thioalkalivibrionaceae bacterium]
MKHLRTRTIAISAATLLALGLMSGAAYAQTAAPEGATGMDAPAAQVALTEQTIDTFVDAFVEVTKVRETYTERMADAADEEAAFELQNEAQEAMIEAVEGAGMSVQEYNEVAMALQNDPQQMEVVQSRVEQRM